jgi:VWFA-related protein
VIAERFASFGFSLLLILSQNSSYAQQSSSARTSNADEQTVVLRSTTRLVQVSVVGLDKNGDPLTGLKKEDFTVLDEGKPQTIAFFSCGAPVATTSRGPLPDNVFTNRADLKGQEPGAVTVILFDSLNTAAKDQGFIREQVLRFIQTLKPQDHVAIYALTNNLVVLHDFTQDVSALVSAVKRFFPKEQAAYSASVSQPMDLVGMTGDTQWQGFQNSLNNAEGQIRDQNTINRVGTTAAALAIIAEHVSAVPGRKNLIWISGGFPIQIGMSKIGASQTQILNPGSSGGGTDPRTFAGQNDPNPSGGGDETNHLTRIEREMRSSEPELGRATRALNRVNMAIYPVDASGVEGVTSLDPGTRSNSNSLPGDFFERQDIRDSSRLLADRTGGKAFYGSNDIRDALRHAFDDGRYACTIGFYPDHGRWDGRFRQIKIKIALQGAHLRYRQGYYSLPDRAPSDATVKADLAEAVSTPLESTSLGMVITGKPNDPQESRSLRLQISVDPKQFDLKESSGHQKGALDMVFSQFDVQEKILAGDKQHLEINFTQKQYEDLSKSGMILQRNVSVLPKCHEIRVVIRDAGSGALGSVVIPVKAFYPE